MTNNIKMRYRALLIVLAGGFLQPIITTAAEPLPGSISIYGNGELACKIEIKPGKYDLLAGDEGCKIKPFSHGSFKLENVRSAVTLFMSANLGMGGGTPTGCFNYGTYYAELRVIKDKLTTDNIPLIQVKETAIGRPVAPGVVLKHATFNNYDYLQVRCLEIRFD